MSLPLPFLNACYRLQEADPEAYSVVAGKLGGLTEDAEDEVTTVKVALNLGRFCGLADVMQLALPRVSTAEEQSNG